MKTWKTSRDPDYATKKARVEHLYPIADREVIPEPGEPDVVFCLDEFGPLNLQPHPGRQWAERGGKHKDPNREPRPRRRATYTRPHGIRHLFAAYDLDKDKLYGHIKKTKDRSKFLEFCRYLRSLYSADVRIAIVCDNYSPHLTTKRCRRVANWAEANNTEIAYTPTNSSWLNRIEAQFTALRYFTLDGTNAKTAAAKKNVDDSGRWWLSFGSFWSGIKLIALNPSTGKRPDTTIRSIAGRNGGAIEAPYMFKHGSYYYLWVSFDRCCQGASSTYRIMVGRSTSPTGPFVDRNGTAMTAGGGTQILAGHGSIHGPGHQAVFADTDSEVLVYHYYANNGASFLGINLIGYDSAGWPFVY
ncbi:family 43 glycosylhydrolase [Plantactinospora sp. CA-294935]|uniref:family 43 glycosylhydrolase n=1 Tax=Plantactinospora sp. CA-294935 TaxID=3240012 RepID=UPI003D8C285B